MRIVVPVRFSLLPNKKENIFLKHYISHHGGVVYLEIQFWYCMRTEKWSWLNCVRFFLPLVTFTIFSMCGTALLPGAASSAAQGDPSPEVTRWDMIVVWGEWLFAAPPASLPLCAAELQNQERDETKHLSTGREVAEVATGKYWRGINSICTFVERRGLKRAALWLLCVKCSGMLGSGDDGLLGTTPGPDFGEGELLCEGWSCEGPWWGSCCHCWGLTHSPWTGKQNWGWQQQVPSTSQGQGWRQTALQEELEWAWGGARILLREVAT